MFEDLARNLEVPHALGMTTVLVVPPATREIVREGWELAGPRRAARRSRHRRPRRIPAGARSLKPAAPASAAHQHRDADAGDTGADQPQRSPDRSAVSLHCAMLIAVSATTLWMSGKAEQIRHQRRAFRAVDRFAQRVAVDQPDQREQDERARQPAFRAATAPGAKAQHGQRHQQSLRPARWRRADARRRRSIIATTKPIASAAPMRCAAARQPTATTAAK